MQAASYHVTLPLLAEADAIARELGHGFIAPEHLLVAVAATADGRSRAFLERHGLTPERLRHAVTAVVGREVTPSADGPRSIAQRTVVALGDAARAGRPRASGVPAPSAANALLVALLGDDVARGAVVEAVLARAGVPLEAARAELERGDAGNPDD